MVKKTSLLPSLLTHALESSYSDSLKAPNTRKNEQVTNLSLDSQSKDM